MKTRFSRITGRKHAQYMLNRQPPAANIGLPPEFLGSQLSALEAVVHPLASDLAANGSYPS